MSGQEKLEAVALIRDGKMHRQFKAGGHWEIRCRLGDDEPMRSNPADTEGFVTNAGRFVSRDEAREIGIASGQLGRMWRDVSRKLLSSDVDW